VTLFNALVDEGEAVVLRAFDTREAAQAAHRGGLRRLFMLLLKDQVKYLEKSLPDAQRLGMLFMPFGAWQELQQQILTLTFDRCCLAEPLPGNEAEFLARGKEAKNRLLLIAQEIARLVGSILNERQALQKVLPQLKAHPQAAQDIRTQLDGLVHKHFVVRTPFERLQHLPRYLKGIGLRIEKLRGNPARDAQQMSQLQPLLQAWHKRRQAAASDPRVEEFGWMLQELRVSLFAQELKTPVIVSIKRLEKMLASLNG
jgi:ATP-dependent helicase HrpA